jgi:hypothetical protein
MQGIDIAIPCIIVQCVIVVRLWLSMWYGAC